MIKVNRNFVGEVERGKQNICLDNLLQLARALTVNPRELFDLSKN
jgi:transcriptional regulator with XRE-family HTH domain